MKKFIISSLLLIGILIGLFLFNLDSPYFIKKKYSLLRYLSKNFLATEILNFKMFLNPKDEVITPFMYSFHHWEPKETAIIFHNLKEGDVFIDVGANVGYYTLLASKKVGITGHVYSFEPETENYEILKQNIILNNLQNVTIEKKAVANKAGRMKLYLNPTNKGDHSLRDDKLNREYQEVDVISLDDYFKDKKIDFIKIDVQGADVLVVQGAKGIISNNPNILIVSEFSSMNFRKMNTDPRVYLDDLSKIGFEFYNIDDKSQSIDKLSIDSIMKRYDFHGIETNLFIVPKQKKVIIK
jgi:FkbM family methyltransferase